jgi:Protein of unknown function (DUF1552)
MSARYFNRRSLISTFAAAAAGPAWFGAMRRTAQVATTPKRLILFYTGHGLIEGYWKPTTVSSADNWAMSPLMVEAGLDKLKSKLNLLHGIDFRARTQFGTSGDGHAAGPAFGLSNYPERSAGVAGGPSFDQILANELAKKQVTPLKSLEIVCDSDGGNGAKMKREVLPSWRAAAERVSYLSNAQNIFARIFPNGQPMIQAPGSTAPDPLIVRKKSVLDLVQKQCGATTSGLDPASKARVGSYCDMIRGIETTLGTDFVTLNGCQKIDPTKLPSGEPKEPISYVANTLDAWRAGNAIRFELIRAALSCGITQVVTVAVSRPPESAVGFKPEYSGTGTYHDLFHNYSDKVASDAPGLCARKSDLLYLQEFARLLTMLSEVDEGNGTTLLDNSGVLWCGEIANGGHYTNGHRWMLGGSMGGSFKTGRYLNLMSGPQTSGGTLGKHGNGQPNANLFVSLANAMKIPMTVFGSPESCTGKLAALG